MGRLVGFAVALRYALQGTLRLTASAVSKKNFHNSKTISLQSNLAGLVWRQSHYGSTETK